MGPTRFERAHRTSRVRVLSRLHQGPGGRVSRGWRLRYSAWAIAVWATPSPLVAAGRGPQVLEEPAHAAPDPQGPFRPESNHLRCPWSILRGRASRTPTAGSTVPNAAVTPCPAKRRSRRTRRALALNTLESPPRAVSDCSWRCGSWYRVPGGGLYFKVSSRSETVMRPWDGVP